MTMSDLGEALARVANPERRCPVEGCDGSVVLGDFGCSPECEAVIADQIARAIVKAEDEKEAGRDR
jgi:hypothetical protein